MVVRGIANCAFIRAPSRQQSLLSLGPPGKEVPEVSYRANHCPGFFDSPLDSMQIALHCQRERPPG